MDFVTEFKFEIIQKSSLPDFSCALYLSDLILGISVVEYILSLKMTLTQCHFHIEHSIISSLARLGRFYSS
jgi:hypothetical protein